MVRGLRRAPASGEHQGLLSELHQQPHHPPTGGHQAGQAYHDPDPEVLQRSPEERASTAVPAYPAEEQGPERPGGPRHPYLAEQLPGAGCFGAADSGEPCQGLQAAKDGEAGDEGPAGREDPTLSDGSGQAGITGSLLPGTDHGTETGRAAGPSLDGPGRGEPNHLHHETGDPHQGRTGGEPAQDPQFHPRPAGLTAGGGVAGGGAQEAPGKSLHVPVAQDGRDVRSGLLPTHPREDPESHRCRAYPVP